MRTIAMMLRGHPRADRQHADSYADALHALSTCARLCTSCAEACRHCQQRCNFLLGETSSAGTAESANESPTFAP